MNFFERKQHHKNTEKKPENENKEKVLVDQDLEGDMSGLGPKIDPAEASRNREELVKSIESFSSKNDNKEWTEGQIKRLEEEVSESIDRNNTKEE